MHICDVINPDGDQLKVGTVVEYDTVPGSEKPRAVKVLVLCDDAD